MKNQSENSFQKAKEESINGDLTKDQVREDRFKNSAPYSVRHEYECRLISAISLITDLMMQEMRPSLSIAN